MNTLLTLFNPILKTKNPLKFIRQIQLSSTFIQLSQTWASVNTPLDYIAFHCMRNIATYCNPTHPIPHQDVSNAFQDLLEKSKTLYVLTYVGNCSSHAVTVCNWKMKITSNMKKLQIKFYFHLFSDIFCVCLVTRSPIPRAFWRFIGIQAC